MKNKFVVQEVAAYVQEQVESSNFGDLLVCTGTSSASLRMSGAMMSMWCPAYKVIDSLADPGNRPDALILPELSSAGLHSLKEYIYTGQTTTTSLMDALIIEGGNYSSCFVDVTLDVEQRQEDGEGDEVEAMNHSSLSPTDEGVLMAREKHYILYLTTNGHSDLTIIDLRICNIHGT